MKFGGSKTTEVYQERRARPWRAPGGGLDAIIKTPSPPLYPKDEIRRSHRKTAVISSSEKKKLIQLGRDEARKSFMKKIQGGS